MHKLLLIGLVAAAICGCEEAQEGQPPPPDVTRPTEIDPDKQSVQGNPPPPPHNIDTATSPGQNVPTSKPATQPAP